MALGRSIAGRSGVSIYTGARFDITRDTIRDTCQIESSYPILVPGAAGNCDTRGSSPKNRPTKLAGVHGRTKILKIALESRTSVKP